MYPWDVLGIEPTDDRKAIKKAYAQLIRQHRPDEDPEGFDSVYQAYQWALSSLSNTAAHDGKSQEHDVESDIFLTSTKSTEQVSECIQKMDALLGQKAALINRLEQWHFLGEVWESFSIEDKNEVAAFAFLKVYEVNNDHIKTTGSPIIKVGTLQYLDQLMGWEDHWREYQFMFTRDCNHLNYDLIEGTSEYLGNVFTVSPWKRLAAMVLDLGLVSLIHSLSMWLMGFEFEWAFYLFMWVMYQLISEIVLKKETLGCFLMKYKILSIDFQSMSMQQRVRRLVLLHMSLMPLYMLMFRDSDWVTKWWVACLLFYVIWIIAFVGGKKLLHDEWSITQAMEA